jgi:hypothetical protein
MSPTAATPGGKNYPWKDVPSWTPLHRKLQQYSTAPLQRPTVDALHANLDGLASISTEFESPPKDSATLMAERPKISPEIPETPSVSIGNVRCEDSHSSDGNAVVGPVGHQPLMGAKTVFWLSLSHTHTDRQQASLLTTCLWGFAILSLPCSPKRATSRLTYLYPFHNAHSFMLTLVDRE